MNTGGDNGRGDAPIGAILEQARRERGLSLSQAEDATKIRKRYLEGLEREDYTMLPDAVYVQGFLKTYANFLGLDGDVLSREFKNRRLPRRERQVDPGGRLRRSEFEKPLVDPGGLPDAERRRISGATIVTVALAVIVLALIIGLLYLVGSRTADTPSSPDDPPAQADSPNRGGSEEDDKAGNDNPAAEEEEAPQEPREEPAEPARSGAAAGGDGAREEPPREQAETVTVVASVPEVPVGMTVRTDGEVAADLVAQPGYSQSFEGREAVVVEAANGGAVTVEVDGEDQGFLAAFGQPVTRTFSP